MWQPGLQPTMDVVEARLDELDDPGVGEHAQGVVYPEKIVRDQAQVDADKVRYLEKRVKELEGANDELENSSQELQDELVEKEEVIRQRDEDIRRLEEEKTTLDEEKRSLEDAVESLENSTQEIAVDDDETVLEESTQEYEVGAAKQTPRDMLRASRWKLRRPVDVVLARAYEGKYEDLDAQLIEFKIDPSCSTALKFHVVFKSPRHAKLLGLKRCRLWDSLNGADSKFEEGEIVKGKEKFSKLR